MWSIRFYVCVFGMELLFGPSVIYLSYRNIKKECIQCIVPKNSSMSEDMHQSVNNSEGNNIQIST